MRSFRSTLQTLDALADAGAQVGVHLVDLDSGAEVLSGDAHRVLPVAGLAVVPVLVEVAAQIESGKCDPRELIDRSATPPVAGAGLWRHLQAPTLPLADLAVLAASAGDPLAANALLERVGHKRVSKRMAALGLHRTALMDRFRDERGPDDAPHLALGSAGEFTRLFASLVNRQVVSPAVSGQVMQWLSLNHDLTLAASGSGLDPFAHESDEHRLILLNKTGRDRGIRTEAGVIAGPRAGVAYTLIVCFDDLSILHRLRAHEAFRVLGLDLMEYVH